MSSKCQNSNWDEEELYPSSVLLLFLPQNWIAAWINSSNCPAPELFGQDQASPPQIPISYKFTVYTFWHTLNRTNIGVQTCCPEKLNYMFDFLTVVIIINPALPSESKTHVFIPPQSNYEIRSPRSLSVFRATLHLCLCRVSLSNFKIILKTSKLTGQNDKFSLRICAYWISLFNLVL